MTCLKSLLLCSLLGTTSMHATACFIVYDRTNTVVYNAQTPPVDMSEPLHETLPKRFPGGHMVITEGNNCPVLQPNPLVAARSTGNAPLLTDRETAESLNVPHTILPSGAALVPRASGLPPARPVFVRPGSKSSAAPDTAPVRMGSPNGAVRANATVITEMHNPPLVAVQTGKSVSISDRP